jgi:hypothetical protein
MVSAVYSHASVTSFRFDPSQLATYGNGRQSAGDEDECTHPGERAVGGSAGGRAQGGDASGGGLRPVRHAARRYRTIWISDVHLGTRGCNDRMLIDFLDHVDSEYLYLVGDIIDGWRMKKRFYWPERHNAIVRRVMKRAKRGTKVIYVPGNHDEMFRQFAGMNFGGVEIRLRATHTDGGRAQAAHRPWR